MVGVVVVKGYLWYSLYRHEDTSLSMLRFAFGAGFALRNLRLGRIRGGDAPLKTSVFFVLKAKGGSRVPGAG